MGSLEKSISEAEKGRENTEERKALLESVEVEKRREQQLISKLKEFADNDPAVLEEMAKEATTALEAANRWTDNIFSIQGWIKKKFPSVDQVRLNLLVSVMLLPFAISDWSR